MSFENIWMNGRNGDDDDNVLGDGRKYHVSLIGQAIDLLLNKSSEGLRRQYIKPPLWPPYDTQIRTFFVQLVGESAMDLGGPYRALFTDWVKEACSPLFPLFLHM